MFASLLFSRHGLDFGKLKLALKYQNLKAAVLHLYTLWPWAF
jgi:hypothetical protein